MKKLLLVAALIISVGSFAKITLVNVPANYSVTANINAAKVPQVVKDAFNSLFPNATNVEWQKDDGNYKVRFTIHHNRKSAIFTPDGTRVG